MSRTLEKMLCLRNNVTVKQGFSFLSFGTSGVLSTCRHYKTKPTRDMGRYKPLIKAQEISGLSATFAEIFLEIIQSNLPERVRLLVKEQTEEDFKGRLKVRPELEEL
ncbi:39S ribosomal protein L48, mitochondrial-like [Otolemur garnettii]|uniref:39S ribosomal protein L48, mitochondrial-like n=1 Tax=Otolemur garnettii TaxID=30611 RepID=UPI000C7F2A09|nr:39S ribosomal protein L48, mitochondrial-like [Otolemur garnettii]